MGLRAQQEREVLKCLQKLNFDFYFFSLFLLFY